MGARRIALAAVLGFSLAGGAFPAQAPVEVGDGERLYLNNCLICHGPNGDWVWGTNLMDGYFTRASTDDGLIRIVRTGIPNTGMPPNNVSEVEAGNILAYLRARAATAPSATPPAVGDAPGGQAIFEGKGECLGCHRVGGNGARMGPDLSDIGARRRPPDLERSILEPGAVVLPQHRFYRVVTAAGATITGRLLNQDTFTIQLIDAGDRLRSFEKADLREHALLKDSQMPSYQGRLTPEELADLVAYLVSLKGIEP